ncbi:MAG: GntR family transcriptional regulator [Caldimonas sp.]
MTVGPKTVPLPQYGKKATGEAASLAGPPLFRTLQREPAYRAVSSVMEQDILSGKLKPGTALPPEQEIATQFGVNRSTVREAIRLLEQEGLLVRHGGRRLFVVLPGIFDLAPRAVRALILHQVTFQELWEVAVVVEPMAARLAAVNADDDDLRAIEQNVQAQADALEASCAVENMRLQSELDVAFHALVARASKNRALMLAREPFSLLYSPALTLLQGSLPQAARRNLQVHRHVVNALKARDADTAHEWVRKHLVDFRNGFRLAGLPMHRAVDNMSPPLPLVVAPAAKRLGI